MAIDSTVDEDCRWDKLSERREGTLLSPLIIQSLKQLESVPLQRIRAAGIWRDRNNYFLNISYPSLQAMQVVNPKAVLSTGSPPGPNSVALYIHIPFCTAECHYCHYYKIFAQPSSVVDIYLDMLIRELSLYADYFDGLIAKSIYIGGGTPSYLTPEQIHRLFKGIARHVEVPNGIEISFEVHPEDGNQEKLEALWDCGINRINVGVESFDDEVLKGEHRRHTAADVRELLDIAEGVGFENVNLDLIYGLRNQSIRQWETNLNWIAQLRPASATLYFLRLKRGTPEYKLWKQFPEQFPSDFDLLLMHVMNFEHLDVELGYKQRPVDWFVRDPKYFHYYQDHNWRLSDEVNLLGIGASAYSYVDGWQRYNINDMKRYNEALSKGDAPIWKAEYLTDQEERMRRTLMLGLKIGIDRSLFCETYGVDALTVDDTTWQKLVELNLVEITPETIELTYSGRLFADEIGQQFYSDRMKVRMEALDPELVSTTWPQFNP